MTSPANVKEVQQLTGRMVALSRFVSASGEKGPPYFQCLKRNNRFVWTKECEEAISAVLVQDQDQTQSPIYFVSKVLQGPEVRYPGPRKGSVSGCNLGEEIAPLLPELHGTGDD